MSLRMTESQRRNALRAFTNAGMLLREFWWDDSAGKEFETVTQDVAPFLKYTHERRAHDGKCSSPTGEWREAAVIPNIVVETWMRKYKINVYDPADTPKVLALLDDPEWAFLRTNNSRLSKRPYRCFFTASTPGGEVKRSSVKKLILAK